MSRVDDLVIEGNEAYLVAPEQPNGAAVLWLHWFDESPTANRSQFLDEAMTLAERGVTSLLPQLGFPWHSPPTDIEQDLARIRLETGRLLAAHAALATRGDVDRIAMVGHDFGAMHGLNLFDSVDFAAAVVIAATPRWSDWFIRFWEIASDRYDYMRALEPVDPVITVARAEFPLLFQFGRGDFYIAPMTGIELYQAAPDPKEMLTYEAGHDMESEEIRADRTSFLARHLGLAV